MQLALKKSDLVNIVFVPLDSIVRALKHYHVFLNQAKIPLPKNHFYTLFWCSLENRNLPYIHSKNLSFVGFQKDRKLPENWD